MVVLAEEAEVGSVISSPSGEARGEDMPTSLCCKASAPRSPSTALLEVSGLGGGNLLAGCSEENARLDAAG